MSQNSNPVDFEILTYNTRGLGDERKRRKIFNYIKKHTSSKTIVFLQETHSTNRNENLWKFQWHGDMIFSHGTSGSRGVCVAFRYGLEYKLLSPKIVDDEGRFIILHIEIQGNPYVLTNYYGPNDETGQVNVLKKLAIKLKEINTDENTQYILGGDWNLVFDKSLDAMGGTRSLKYRSLKELQAIISDYNLADIWRIRNPTLRQFTWRRANPLTMRRLDFFLISDNLQYEVKLCKHLTPVQSDHSPVNLCLSSLGEGTGRGRGYWKFNNSLIEDKVFVESLKQHIGQLKSLFYDEQDPRINWDYLKYKIFRFSKQYANERAEKRKSRRKHLEEKVSKLEREIVDTEGDSEDVILEYESAKNELEKLYEYITNGIILRSKAQWYEEGEKNTKYFLSLEKNNKAKSHIRKLMDSEGEEITDQKKILKEINGFYANLYEKKSPKTEQECLQYLASINTPKLSEVEKESCEGRLTLQNCWDALITMKNGKSPGNDGLTKEFYVCFFDDVASLLIKSLNFSFTVGELSTSQKQAVITLIEKKGRDRRLAKNWRPISLMNVDTKIASKVLALRMKKVIPSIINYDQTAYVKGRYIGESVRLIDDILFHAESENLDGILFAADMEKAFDSIEHNFIFATLSKFGFGKDFIQWIKTVLCNGISCVMNNGFASGYFSLERGARQGDPLSPYIFILCIETLFAQIRNDRSIRGFKFDSLEIKLTSFADDVTFLVRDSNSVKRILKLIKGFGIFSSLKINVEKCEACWIGKSKGNTGKPVPCKWVSLQNNVIKVLGTHFSYNKSLEEKMNFYNLRTDCRTILNLWKQRWLSLAGKIQTFKSLIASRPVYIATVKHLPQKILDELQEMHNEFLWDGKRAKIKHSTLIGNYDQGGLKDVDLPSKFASLKYIWIRKMFDATSYHPWIAVADKILKNLGGISLFHTNIQLASKIRRKIDSIPIFYKELLNTWKTLSHGSSTELEFILSQSVWNNKSITCKNDTLWNEELNSKGVKTVYDLLNTEGKLCSWEEFSEKYNISAVNFLSWYGILSSIPREWKNIINNTRSVSESIDWEQFNSFKHGIFIDSTFFDILKVKTSRIYNHLVQKKFRPPTAQKKLSEKYDIREEMWSKIYSLPSKCTIDTKTRVFQYKILNNILYLNKILYRMKITETPMCYFCRVEEETVVHLFSECNFSTKIWKELQEILSEKLDLLELNAKNVIFGFIDGEITYSVQNHLLLLYKRYVYICRLMEKSISFSGFKCFLKTTVDIEKRIAVKKNKVAKHLEKWDPVSQMF